MPVHVNGYLSNFPNAEQIFSQTKASISAVNIEGYFNYPYENYMTSAEQPTWIYVHPEGMIIKVGRNIDSEKKMDAFISHADSIYLEFDEVYDQFRKSKVPNEILNLLKKAVFLEDMDYSGDLMNDYIKRLDKRRLPNSAFREILELGKKAPWSKQLNKLIKNQNNRAIALTSEKDIALICQQYILYDLRKKQLFEPFYVWQRYEKELGVYADSLYRLFAIQYFGTHPIEKELLYAEAFDYISIYPRTPWETLDPLYQFVVLQTTNKEDLELLLDLISFQLFRGKHYRKLDFKAFVLYKLGQHQRALDMIQEINQLAMESGVKYRSMIYSLR